jgi:hypothetical protein
MKLSSRLVTLFFAGFLQMPLQGLYDSSVPELKGRSAEAM